MTEILPEADIDSVIERLLEGTNYSPSMASYVLQCVALGLESKSS
jgi:hypothetical protein